MKHVIQLNFLTYHDDINCVTLNLSCHQLRRVISNFHCNADIIFCDSQLTDESTSTHFHIFFYFPFFWEWVCGQATFSVHSDIRVLPWQDYLSGSPVSIHAEVTWLSIANEIIAQCHVTSKSQSQHGISFQWSHDSQTANEDPMSQLRVL